MYTITVILLDEMQQGSTKLNAQATKLFKSKKNYFYLKIVQMFFEHRALNFSKKNPIFCLLLGRLNMEVLKIVFYTSIHNNKNKRKPKAITSGTSVSI